ncbi:MAG: hypothetical protein GF364_18985 [Candidatus Lokiarchaeota archaeon]|nr:hypothetical protein [Candidatus Lokiarchaeota archaeon]
MEDQVINPGPFENAKPVEGHKGIWQRLDGYYCHADEAGELTGAYRTVEGAENANENYGQSINGK